MFQIQDELAYVIHTMPYRGTSLLCDVLTQNHGRMRLMALSARGQKSRFKNAFRTFSLLNISVRGRSELKNVTSAQVLTCAHDMDTRQIYCGYYLNELIRYLVPLEESNENLYQAYHSALSVLFKEDYANSAVCLRIFEKKLLSICGYEINFNYDMASNQPFLSNQHYRYHVGEGFSLVQKHEDSIPGQVILCIAQDQWHQERVQYYAKVIFRQAINALLAGKRLASRDILMQLV